MNSSCIVLHTACPY